MSAGGREIFECVGPQSDVSSEPFDAPRRLEGLADRRIALLSTAVTRSDVVLESVASALLSATGSPEVLDIVSLGHESGAHWIDRLRARLRESRCDAVVVGVGTTGSNTPAVLAASEAAERDGIPSVAVVSAGSVRLAQQLVSAMGRTRWPIAVFDGQLMTMSDESVSEMTYTVLVPRVFEALRTRPDEVRDEGYPEHDQVVMRGVFDEVQRHFHEHEWSDGLPIVPPTRERVEDFLRFTDKAPGCVLGVLPMENRKATIWSVAVNGVLAGCEPELMPVLVGIVEAFADDHFGFQDVGSSPGWEPLVTVSGPISSALNMNYGGGVMRTDRRSNASIGRFARLYMRNIGGWRVGRGTDTAGIGLPTNSALAEDEHFVREIGWPTYGDERGVPRGRSAVTVQSILSVSPPIYSAGRSAVEHAKLIADVFGERTCGYWAPTGYRYKSWAPLLMICPAVAEVFSSAGWSKDDLRAFLAEHAAVPVEAARRYLRAIGLPEEPDWDSHRRRLPDGAEVVSVFPYPEQIGIVVAGDRTRNQSRGYVQNHRQGLPTTKLIQPGVGA